MQLDNRKIMLISIAIAVLLAIVLIIGMDMVTAGGSSGGGSNLPIWIAALVPIWAAAEQKRRKKERKAREQETPIDRYEMMERLVERLDDDETDYLRHRLIAEHGDILQGEY